MSDKKSLFRYKIWLLFKMSLLMELCDANKRILVVTLYVFKEPYTLQAALRFGNKTFDYFFRKDIQNRNYFFWAQVLRTLSLTAHEFS